MEGSSLPQNEVPCVIFSLEEEKEMSQYVLDSPVQTHPPSITPEVAVSRAVNPNVVATDTDKEDLSRPYTAPILRGKRLFHSHLATTMGPLKRSRVTSSSGKGRHTNSKPKFKATPDMDFNHADALLFNFLFSEGNSMQDTLVKMCEYHLTRGHIQSLMPGRVIDDRVVEMVSMRNACSIQHVKHAFFWCLPPRFADDVIQCTGTEELVEMYVPFWMKPSRFLGRIFIPIEDIFMHWWCMVVDFSDKCAYQLNSYPDPNMLIGREKLMRTILGRLHDVMTSPDFRPIRMYIPSDLANWPIRRGQGIPNCNNSDSFASWVISWLNPAGTFNSMQISGVLDDSTVRTKTAVDLAGGPFNAMGSMVRRWATQWQRGSTA